MKKDDKGIDDLLNVIKNNPGVVKSLVFDQAAVKKLLKSAAAQQLALGEEATAFLEYVASPKDGYAIVQCGGNTRYLCAKGSAVIFYLY